MVYQSRVTRSITAALFALGLGLGIAPLGCNSECEFAIIPKTESCPTGCSTINRQDIAEGFICADYDCSTENPCAMGFQCVAVGKPVCLPSCEEDTDCEDGLVCTNQIDGIGAGDTKACFFDG
jgi:hypothetical protein